MSFRRIINLTAALLLLPVLSGIGAESGFKVLPGHVPDVLAKLAPEGIVPATNRLQLSLGLPLHHQAELAALIQQL